ncbi:Metallo-dependent phosphatase [Wolfiporia cocos MD-104 SS10]|uniref:Serine/threonine-protein phosphatase n=1 Tax=Wolfiporia cocos (strain MD-104) TaxID=742152 RepID=A0A2H3JIA7_WOLCO|nr:Metallo-dependent phosphatase [Wolfiporia cocos MD-104 SS10]
MLREHFYREGRLTERQALHILEHATRVLSEEPNVLHVAGPVTVCGDIHGQYYDLMKIFDVGGTLAENNYLFLGDYVDRGYFSIECLLYLYALKIRYPTRVFLLRGNHECRHLTEYFTFKRECLHKYTATVYEACIKSFQALPVAALIDGKFFCVHGGISPELIHLEDIVNLNRFMEPASHGLLCDLLWADPMPNFGHEQEPTPERPHGVPVGQTFETNHARGCSFYFTYEAACQFLERNSLLGIIRGHEAQDAGYTMYRKTPTKKFPSVITVFSAPNYLDAYRNRAAVIRYKDRNITIRQYNASPHPYWLPNFMDAFTWSLPFVGAKITEMLLAILSVCSESELEDTYDITEEEEERARVVADETSEEDGSRLEHVHPNYRRQEFRNKILDVTKMQKVFQLLRQEAESATELAPSAQSATAPWPGGFARPASASDALGVHTTRQYIRTFHDAQQSDLLNERLPQYMPSASSLVPVPSMRLPGLAMAPSSEGADERVSIEALIRRVYAEEGMNDGGMAERLADAITKMGSGQAAGRPKGLKRFETAP